MSDRSVKPTVCATLAPMTCPTCGRPVESRRGNCIVINREPIAHGVVLIEAEIRHCEAAWERCEWFEAGHLVDGHFLHDPELIPLISDQLEKLLTEPKDQPNKRRPRHDPGE